MRSVGLLGYNRLGGSKNRRDSKRRLGNRWRNDRLVRDKRKRRGSNGRDSLMGDDRVGGSKDGGGDDKRRRCGNHWRNVNWMGGNCLSNKKGFADDGRKESLTRWSRLRAFNDVRRSDGRRLERLGGCEYLLR